MSMSQLKGSGSSQIFQDFTYFIPFELSNTNLKSIDMTSYSRIGQLKLF